MSENYNDSVLDSSVIPHPKSVALMNSADTAIRTGIIREVRKSNNGGSRYVVEVNYRSRQVPVLCTIMSRFNGAWNFEEIRPRTWAKNFSNGMGTPASASSWTMRAGDTVLVAYVDGDPREGIILGGIGHPSRLYSDGEKTNLDNIEYYSTFQGLETQIRKDGSFKTTFNGVPVNEKQLELPPMGQAVPPPIYDPLIQGSFYGFDKTGSFIVADKETPSNIIKIYKSVTGGSIILKSGTSTVELTAKSFGTSTVDIKLTALNSIDLKATNSVNIKGLSASIKSTKLAIGSDTFELFDGLIQLIDTLGTIVVTSPVGTCTPVKAAPTWVKMEILKAKIKTLKTSLQDPSEFSLSGDDTNSIGDDIGQ